MALSQSTTSISSDTSSIFALESDGRCMTLREKRQDVRVLFERWESAYKRYAVYTQDEIQASDDIFEAVTDLDTERSQVCFAILDFALFASNHFDVNNTEDRMKYINVINNVVRKKEVIDKMPFLLQANRNNADMVKAARLPFAEEMLPPQIGKKRCHFDSSETSTQLPEGKRHAGLSPIPVVERDGEVGEIAVSSGPRLEVGPDGAVLNHQPILNANDLGSPAMPNYNLLVVPDATQYHAVPTKYGPHARRISQSVTPNLMDFREGNQLQQQEEHLQNLQDQREQAMQGLVDKVQAQAKERDEIVADMQEKMRKMVEVHNEQLEQQRKAAEEKEKREKAEREEELRKKRVEVAEEKRKLQEEFHKKQLEMLQNVGKVRGEEADRMKQILDCLGKEVAEKRAGVRPTQEDENPEWTEDESAVASAPWLQAKSKRKGSKSSPTQLKKTQQSHHQPQRSEQDIQRQQQLLLQQQRAEKRRQAEEKKQKEREEAQERAREEERQKEREEAEEQVRRSGKPMASM